MAVRTLLHIHGSAKHEEHDLEHEHKLATMTIHSSTLDLRIAALFVILLGAVLLGLPTLLLKQFQSPDAPLPRLSRAFAGGVLLALALVHVIPEAVVDLNSLLDFPIGGCTILLGLILLAIVDSSVAALLHSANQRQPTYLEQQDPHSPALSAKYHLENCHKDRICFYPNPLATNVGQQTCETGVKGVATYDKTAELVVLNLSPDSPMIAAHHSDADKDTSSGKGYIILPETAVASHPPTHSHQCVHSMKAHSWQASRTTTAFKRARQCVTAYTMELGCIFHSIIIGVGLGVISEDRHLVLSLMIALAVHQALEGLALGSVLALTDFTSIKKFAMLLLYSITTPLGIVIGIAVSSSYDPESVTSKAVQGTVNGVSGGMLLYIGMFQLVGEELSRQDLLVLPKLRAGLYGAMCLGAALMCVLAMWA